MNMMKFKYFEQNYCKHNYDICKSIIIIPAQLSDDQGNTSRSLEHRWKLVSPKKYLPTYASKNINEKHMIQNSLDMKITIQLSLLTSWLTDLVAMHLYQLNP